MKVIEFSRYGIPHEVCACVEVDDPGPPAAGEIVVSIDACSINPADLLIIEGRYPGPASLPSRLGIEGVGRVLAVADNVQEISPGDRVMLLDRENWAERVATPANRVIRISEELDPLQAAMMKVNPPTALLMLSDYVDLEPSDWVIQNAANSAVGRHVVRLAGQRGIRTINIVRRASAVSALVSAGADLVFVDGKDLAHRVRAEIGESGLPLALDAIGGPSCLHLAECLSNGGKLVNYGFLSGEPCMITPHQAIVSGISLHGFWLVNHLFQGPRVKIEETYRHITELILDGTVSAPVAATYPLDDVQQALAHAARGGRGGKILFVPGGGCNS